MRPFTAQPPPERSKRKVRCAFTSARLISGAARKLVGMRLLSGPFESSTISKRTTSSPTGNILVSEHAVEVEQIEEQHSAVRIECLVGEYDRHVIVARGQPIRIRVRIILVARITLVILQEPAHQTGVSVLRRKVLAVVVVPHGV